MAKHKILVKTEHYLTGVGMLEVIRMELGEAPDISLALLFSDVQKRLNEEQFDMLVMEIKIKMIRSQLDKDRLEMFLKIYSAVKILVLCDLTDIGFCRWLYTKGVLGVTDVNNKPQEMGKAIANVYNGNMHVDNSMLMRMVKQHGKPQ